MTSVNHFIIFRARYTTIRIRDINDGEKDTIILYSASILRKKVQNIRSTTSKMRIFQFWETNKSSETRKK